MTRSPVGLSALLFCCLVASLSQLGAQEAPTTPPSAGDAGAPNAAIVDATELELSGLGLIQGISEHDGKLYVYGDLALAEPRVGMIREFDPDFKPTGRAIRLVENGKPLVVHPTGLTWSRDWGAFLGDTYEKKATIYQLDWEKALETGTLDGCVKTRIVDDAAVNGCRPLAVTVQGREWLATADYGDVRPEIRLLEPNMLITAKRTSAPGVIGARILCGPFNQNLAWEPATKRLTCIQNTRGGAGWRLDVLDLEKAVADGRADGPGVRIAKYTFPTKSELEGYLPLGEGRGVFVVASLGVNATIGRIEKRSPSAVAPTAPMKP